MTQKTNALDRRTALKKGGVVMSTLTVGLPTISGTAAAAHIDSMVVDVPPAISPQPKGNVTVAIYPGGDKTPRNIAQEMGNGGALKLGPHEGGDSIEPSRDELELHAEAARWKLVTNGIHGEVLGVFFDATSADEWFTPGDSQAKVSAVKGESVVDDSDIFAWGWQSVTIPGTS